MQVEIIMRALGDPTRLRIMRLLGAMELAVGELAQVLEQSQPRVSQHVAKLCDAGLAERHREGSWVFLRTPLAQGGRSPFTEALSRLLALAEREDAEFQQQCDKDRAHLAAIREARQHSAENYFAAHAEEWDDLRRLHSPDATVEQALLKELVREPLGDVLDIGTGTGRIAELFAGEAAQIVALDKSPEMLRLARAKLQHIPPGQVELVQGDFAELPFPARRFDTIVLHQVLHFAADPLVPLREAARVTKPGGRIAIVDFDRHEREELRERHAHARLGFDDAGMADLLTTAGFEPAPPETLPGAELTVKIWTARRLSALDNENMTGAAPATGQAAKAKRKAAR